MLHGTCGGIIACCTQGPPAILPDLGHTCAREGGRGLYSVAWAQSHIFGSIMLF